MLAVLHRKILNFLQYKRPQGLFRFQYVLIISCLVLLLGYASTDIVLKDDTFPLLTSFSKEWVNNPGAVFFFQNNIGFFFVVSILPVINLPLLIFQLFVSGVQSRLIVSLSLDKQIEIFYRHFVFEYLALLLSVYISSLLYSLFKTLHDDREYDWKNDVMYILICYTIIAVCTVLAALLEGVAFA